MPPRGRRSTTRSRIRRELGGRTSRARNVVALGAPVVYYSTDYVFDGTKRGPYLESDPTNPLGVYARTKLEGEQEVRDGWIVRSSWLFGWTGHNFVRTMLRLGAERDEVSVVDDQRGSPTYVGHLAEATRDLLDRPHGVYHVAAEGDCTWADFAEAIFDEAGLSCRVNRITAAEFGLPAPRPPTRCCVAQKGAPQLPHWREGYAPVARPSQGSPAQLSGRPGFHFSSSA